MPHAPQNAWQSARHRTGASQREIAAALAVVAPTARELGGPGSTGLVWKAVVGIGQDAGARLAWLLEQRRPGLVLSLGFAGSLKPGLRTGALTLHSLLMDQDDGRKINCVPAVSETVRSALTSSNLDWQEGPLLTVQRPLLTPAAKHARGLASGALAVDMEGYWLAEAAGAAGVPMIAIRAILDELDHDLPSVVDDMIADGGRNELRHAVRALRDPRAAASLALLALRSLRAARALHRAAKVCAGALAGAAGSRTP